MTDVKLFFAPGAVSRVTMTALELTGIEYEAVKVDAEIRETAEFKAINPHGKVPALAWGDRTLAESSAIVWFLYSKYPDAGILPAGMDELEAARKLAELIWASSSLHALVARFYKPSRYTVNENETDGILADVTAKLMSEYENIVATVGDGFWYGEEPSVMDAYLTWTVETSEVCNFDVSSLPALRAYVERVNSQYGAYKKAVEREGPLNYSH